MPHETLIKVRTYECDEYAHVNNAVYLNYLEHARVEFLDHVGFPYRELRQKGYGVVVTNISIDYHRELLAGDEITIATTPLEVGRVSGVFEQRILRQGVLIARATVRWAFLNQDGRPQRLGDELVRILSAV